MPPRRHQWRTEETEGAVVPAQQARRQKTASTTYFITNEQKSMTEFTE